MRLFGEISELPESRGRIIEGLSLPVINVRAIMTERRGDNPLNAAGHQHKMVISAKPHYGDAPCL